MSDRQANKHRQGESAVQTVCGFNQAAQPYAG